MNTKTLFNDHWLFAKSSLTTLSHTNLTFKPVAVPHDWLIVNTLDLYEDGIGWYKKSFDYSSDCTDISLLFDGVYMDSELYVNEAFVGEWKYGYSAFELNISDYLVQGENEILLKVTHKSPNSRWYTGAGIYRNVWLLMKGHSKLPTDGIYISTKQLENNFWELEIETEVITDVPVLLSHVLTKDNAVIAVKEEIIHATSVNSEKLAIASPLLWNTDTPHLYKLSTTIQNKETKKIIERVYNSVGFRTLKFSATDGFFVNGIRTKIFGVCEHHDFGALGSAFNLAALRHRFKILKEMGVNAIRTAHNMPAKEFMNLADEMGFYIVSESFDMWERSKTPYDYARFFKEWAYRDIESWIKRDRNHPSLIMWSIGNEIYDTHASEDGIRITEQLQKYVLEFDPKENAVVTIGSNYLPWENARASADVVKVVGYNYGDKYYSAHHQEYPDWIIYGSETGSVVQSRGIYHFPYDKPILADDDFQCSALGNSSTSWGARSAEAILIAERDTPYSLGQFIWTGFDYIGEPTPYHTKNSYFGQIDTATFKKDSFYIYQANWTDYRTAPMIHLFPYWDFNPGQLIDVRVATNAPYFELYLNGELISATTIDHAHGSELVPTIKIPFRPGELSAIAYDENRKQIARDVVHSFSDASKVILTPDKYELTADGQDLIFVTISMEDKSGYPVSNATNRVNVSVEGAGRLVGLDNGDSTDYDAYKGLSRRLFSGKLMAIIAATDKCGDIKVKVDSLDLPSETLTLKAINPVAKRTIEGPFPANKAQTIQTGCLNELPLRKIELVTNREAKLSNEFPELTVKADFYPKNASYNDLEWSIVLDGGIPSNLATIEASGDKAIVRALGDGVFRVRCMSKNGREHISLISEIEVTAVGLGTAYKNPYALISGALFDDSVGEVTSGNERGVATSRDGTTQIGFHQIDFGKYGSDTINLPLFSLTDGEYPLEIWEGSPLEKDSTLLAKEVYQKKSIWNVYQPVTYQLSKKLSGVTSLYFVFFDKVHLKGFSFDPSPRAFEKLHAVDADAIYGDSFKQTKTTLEDIGNNVSIVFNEMDFNVTGAVKLRLCGHSPIDINTIHVRFENEEGQINQLIDFNQSANYEERLFNISAPPGKQKVSFIFLPGSNFNFKWFKFEK